LFPPYERDSVSTVGKMRNWRLTPTSMEVPTWPGKYLGQFTYGLWPLGAQTINEIHAKADVECRDHYYKSATFDPRYQILNFSHDPRLTLQASCHSTTFLSSRQTLYVTRSTSIHLVYHEARHQGYCACLCGSSLPFTTLGVLRHSNPGWIVLAKSHLQSTKRPRSQVIGISERPLLSFMSK
jgi:hypothetical protein